MEPKWLIEADIVPLGVCFSGIHSKSGASFEGIVTSCPSEVRLWTWSIEGSPTHGVQCFC